MALLKALPGENDGFAPRQKTMALRLGENSAPGKTVDLRSCKNMVSCLGNNNAQNVKYRIVKAENIKEIQDTFSQNSRDSVRYSKKYCQHKVSRYFVDTAKPW